MVKPDFLTCCCCLSLAFILGQVVGGLADYTITPSSQLAHYHYQTRSTSLSSATATAANRAFFGQSQPPPYQPLRPYQYQPPAAQQQLQSRQLHQHQHQQQQQHSSSAVARQFSSPALESAAFTMALTSQGYRLNGGGVGASTSSGSSELRSLNVKLPLPLGITPINIAPLPLQAGAPYSTLKGVTSYGTLHPQRRRR